MIPAGMGSASQPIQDLEDRNRMKLIDRIVYWVTRHYKLTLFAVFMISAVMGLYYLNQRQDNNIGVFFEENDIIYREYKDFVDEYGSEEFVVLAFKENDFFTNPVIDLTRKLSDALNQIYGVERVMALTDVEEVVGQEDAVIFRKLIPEGAFSDAALQRIKEKVLANPVARGNLISLDGKTSAILVELQHMQQKDKFDTLENIVKASQAVVKGRTKIYYTGIPFLENETNRLSQKDVRIFSVATSLIIFLIVTMIFKDLTLSFLAMMTLFTTQIWGIGLFVLCGEKMNWVTSAMTAILLAMAIADSVHLISHLKKVYRPGQDDIVNKIAESTRAIFMPCLLTTLTTCIGYLSFTTSPLRPSCIMGLFTAIGVFLAFVIDVTFLPSAMVLMRDRIARSLSAKRNDRSAFNEGLLHRWLSSAGRFSTTYVKTLLVVFAALIVFSVAGMTRLKFETNSANYLNDANPIKQDAMFLDKNLGGAIPFMVLIRSEGEADFTDPAALKLVERVQDTISEHDKAYITKSTSIVDYVKEFNKAFNGNDDAFYAIPDSHLEILDSYELGDTEILQRLISHDKKEVCINFLSKWGSNERAVASGIFYRKKLTELLGDDFSFTVTGITKLYITMEEMLKTSQKRSFSVAFVLIFIMMLFVCRNFKLALISMAPNIFPIVFTLGIMGWLNIALDAATIMIASVTLGIAVDDTIHFIAWYRRLSGPGTDAKEAIRQTFLFVGKPIIVTTILLFFGFGVFILGSFKPTQTFGVLTAFSMLFALIGDLFLLPAVILMLKPEIRADKLPRRTDIGCQSCNPRGLTP